MITTSELNLAKHQYINHLTEATSVFNDWAEQKQLPVKMDASKIVHSIVNDQTVATRVVRYHQRTDDSGIIHPEQLKTAVDCLVQLYESPQKTCGHVLGAMQSGKTTTSLALQWAGPVLYLLTGRRAYPFYLIGNQTNHEDQTKAELKSFLMYYGDIEFKTIRQFPHEIDALFAGFPTLSTYRDHILTDPEDTFNVPELGDDIIRRVGGGNNKSKVAEKCHKATEQGFQPLMIIDEPQYGASDRVVRNAEGITRYPCVLAQMFDRIEELLTSDRSTHWFIGLSATPFELNDLSRMWEVRQYLSERYSGFNFFNQTPISPDVNIVPPITISQTDFASQIGVPFIEQVSPTGYNATGPAFTRFARRIGYRGDELQYRTEVINALRNTIYKVIEQNTNSTLPVGLCIRAFNNNARTMDFIQNLGLDQGRVEVLNYYGSDATGCSIKRLISLRKRKDLPYVIFVTNRARMADAFPVEVSFFMDFSHRASDLNALLQGLLGRACGYNKASTVVLSDENIGIIDAYLETNGGYVYTTSRHSITTTGFRRGAPTSMIKLTRDMDDRLVREFFQKMDEYVQSKLQNGVKNIKGLPRMKGGQARTGPILRFAEELMLFDHIEAPGIRSKIFPQIPSGFKVARSSDQVRHSRTEGLLLQYFIDGNGDCRFTFRWTRREDGAQGGAAGRAKGRRDAESLSVHMEPTVYVEKYDPTTGEVIYDSGDSNERPGNWRAFMITFPLVDPVREIQAAEIALPNENCVYDYQMTAGERVARDQALAS